jgi:hypothetical protein
MLDSSLGIFFTKDSMNTKSKTKHCQNCGELKPSNAFIVGRDTHGKTLYSVVCAECRNQILQEDDDGSSGEKNDLSINNEDQEFRKAKLEELEEKIARDKEDYFEEQDEVKEDHQEKKQANELIRDKAKENKTKKPLGLFSPIDKKTKLAGETNTFHNVHDPLKKNPISKLSDTIYNANPDREDVKAARRNVSRIDAYRHGSKPTNEKTSAPKTNASMFNQTTNKTTQPSSTKAAAQEVVNFIRKSWGR